MIVHYSWSKSHPLGLRNFDDFTDVPTFNKKWNQDQISFFEVEFYQLSL